MSFSNYAEAKIIRHIFNAGSFPASTKYLGLCTASPGEAGIGSNCNEVVFANGYSRTITYNYQWRAAASGLITNAAAIVFPEAVGLGWGTVTHFAIFDAASFGNILVYGYLAEPKTVLRGSVPVFYIDELGVTLD